MRGLSQIPPPGQTDAELARGKFVSPVTIFTNIIYHFRSIGGVGGVGGMRQTRFVSQEREARQQYTIFKEGGPGYTKYIVYTADNSDRK